MVQSIAPKISSRANFSNCVWKNSCPERVQTYPCPRVFSLLLVVAYQAILIFASPNPKPVAVEKHLGLNEQQFYDEFNEMMRAVEFAALDKDYAPAGWNIPDGDIKTHVDFQGINFFQQ